MVAPGEIDRLIEHGLTLYGQGDLDGALEAWEEALSADPENAQASSYVDYVRQNYDMLTGDVANDEAHAPFALDEEPYQIEVLIPSDNGDATDPQLQPPPGVDAGWDLEDEPPSEPPPASQALQLDLEDVSDAHAPVASEFAEIEITPGVDPAGGFGSLPTNLRERDTGFVRATGAPSKSPPELSMTLRTPAEAANANDSDNPFGDIELSPQISGEGDAPSEPPTPTPPPSEAPGGERLSLDVEPPAPDVDLLSSLPTPTPSRAARSATADLPPSLRPPAASNGGPPPIDSPTIDDPSHGTAPTQDFESQKTNARQEKPEHSREVPTRDLPNPRSPYADMVGAPTRDLGLRPPGSEPETVSGEIGDGTRADVYLPFDPIGVRSAQILDDVDEGAPDHEELEDRTRRRITTLFERAAEWGKAGELDRAVAAIDLAMAEDPNSALGQKLIHRNRETMMTVFQAFLGSLDRQPVLARPLHELANAPISPRAAFLLSRVDGTLTLDELLDVSGMPKIEAYRYLCQLFLRGILR